MLDYTLSIILLLFAVAVIAGWIDVVAGGGGLLTVPVLMMVGLPPAVAVATNKLQGTAGTFSASLFFIRKGQIDLRLLGFPVLCTLVGSVLGSFALLQFDASQLMLFLPILLVAIGLYYWLSPSISDLPRKARLGIPAFSVGVCLALGFYDGFLGPGAGSLYALALVSLMGYGLAKATAYAKVLNFVSNFSALVYFLLFGQIAWIAGFIMMAGQLIGAQLGARSVLLHGSALIKPMVVVVCFAMSGKLLYDHWV